MAAIRRFSALYDDKKRSTHTLRLEGMIYDRFDAEHSRRRSEIKSRIFTFAAEPILHRSGIDCAAYP